MNLLPNLEVFLSELRKQPQVENIQEEDNGSVIIKLKQELPESNPFITHFADIVENLNLKRYINVCYKEEVEIGKSDLPENFGKLDPIQLFIEKVKSSCVGEPKITDTEIVLFLKPEVVKDYTRFSEMAFEARKFGATILICPRVGLSIPKVLPKPEKSTGLISAFKVDLSSLHADRLREFLHRDITKADVAESINYLLNSGWTEKKLLGLGFSHTNLHRYKKYRDENEGK